MLIYLFYIMSPLFHFLKEVYKAFKVPNPDTNPNKVRLLSLNSSVEALKLWNFSSSEQAVFFLAKENLRRVLKSKVRKYT